MRSCIIIPPLTLTCNRVTTQHKQTRPSPGILLFPFLLLLYLLFLFCFLHLLTSSLSLCLLSLPLSQGRSCLSRFLISPESREAVGQLHISLISRSLSMCLSVCLSLFLQPPPTPPPPFKKCHAALTLTLKVRTLLLIYIFFNIYFFASCFYRIMLWKNKESSFSISLLFLYVSVALVYTPTLLLNFNSPHVLEWVLLFQILLYLTWNSLTHQHDGIWNSHHAMRLSLYTLFLSILESTRPSSLPPCLHARIEQRLNFVWLSVCLPVLLFIWIPMRLFIYLLLRAAFVWPCLLLYMRIAAYKQRFLARLWVHVLLEG